ncbi:hypothetical protein FOCG_06358 [Fusarium oxysporum f. sp. radicis-lycopersici 26381]|nr:hypothetical protein FOCG_06358 [Fusarium oxysporum f. sp. radicis-lycopersici 26381]
MADKPTTAPQTSTIPTMTTAEKSSPSSTSSSNSLRQFNNNIDKLFNGSRSLPVRVSDAAPLRIMPGYSGTFDVRMTNNANDPVWFKVDN